MDGGGAVRHDRWSRMGEEHLGEMNIEWVERMEQFPQPHAGAGALTLMKAIINDHWADVPRTEDWPAEHVDRVMSKLYWCWCRWLSAVHPEEDEGDEADVA